MDIDELVIAKTRRVPLPTGPHGDGSIAARQFDAVLMAAGFKASRDLLEHLSGLTEGTVIDTAVRALAVLRRQVGDHVQHNVYFRDFPKNVPDTIEFWVSCLVDALLDPVAAAGVTSTPGGYLNLLSLPKYGRYQHTYEEMLAAHAELIPAAGDRVTVLHLGADVDAEASDLYLSLAGGRTPLGEEDLAALAQLAEYCVAGPQPETIPVRENRAVINQVRLRAGFDLLIDTATDVLRLACALSDGDVTLQNATRFRSLRRPERRALLVALDQVVADNPAKLGDIAAHREPWKRLGERLHPHEYPAWPHAARVFAVARGQECVPSFQGRLEEAMSAGDVVKAADLLRSAPGVLIRSLDRLLRSAHSTEEQKAVMEAVQAVADRVAGRVLLSVREHLQNRTGAGGGKRVFANRKGRAWVSDDGRSALERDAVERLLAVLDGEVQRRLPTVEHLLVDAAMLGVALPLTGSSAPAGFGVLPRGSTSVVDGQMLRFFVYWKQAARRTDYDLSALLLNADYGAPSHLSWTALTGVGGVHSGDITSAPNGASEFIDLDLKVLPSEVVIPQVDVFAGEGFEETEESFFGFMVRDAAQGGRPFEPRTVRMKSDLRGAGRVALPLVFIRGAAGGWTAKWLHFYLKGHAAFNQVEGNRVSSSMLVRGVVDREYLHVRYLTDLWAAAGAKVTVWDGGDLPAGPVTFVGLERPEGLHEASEVVTLESIGELIPA